MTKRRKDIAKWLIDHDLTQKQIAEEAGVTASLVCHVVRGTRSGKAVMEVLKRRGFIEAGEPDAGDPDAMADGLSLADLAGAGGGDAGRLFGDGAGAGVGDQ